MVVNRTCASIPCGCILMIITLIRIIRVTYEVVIHYLCISKAVFSVNLVSPYTEVVVTQSLKICSTGDVLFLYTKGNRCLATA